MKEFFDLNGARIFLNKIKELLEKEDWQQDGDYYTYGKIYKNISPYFKIGGVTSIDDILIEEKSVTVPATAFNSAKQISLAGDGYDFTFGAPFNPKVESGNMTIRASGGNGTIVSGKDKVTLYAGEFHLQNSGNKCMLYGLENNTITNSGDYVSIYGGPSSGSSGTKIFSNSGSYASIHCGYIGSNTITVSNTGDFVSINGSGNNSINNSGNYVNISPSTNSSINNIGDFALINSRGNQTVSLCGGAANCSVQATVSDTSDLIYNNDKGNSFIFSHFNGNHTVQGFNTGNDIITVNSTSTSISSAVVDSDTTLYLKYSSYTTTILLPGISSGTVKVKSSDNQYAGLITIGSADTVLVSDLTKVWNPDIYVDTARGCW